MTTPPLPCACAVRMFSSATKPLESPTTSFNEPDMGGAGVGVVEAFTPEMREKMVRMEKEIQILRRRVETAESASPEGGDIIIIATTCV